MDIFNVEFHFCKHMPERNHFYENLFHGNFFKMLHQQISFPGYFQNDPFNKSKLTLCGK